MGGYYQGTQTHGEQSDKRENCLHNINLALNESLMYLFDAKPSMMVE